MNIKELKDFIKDLPEDMEIIHEYDGCMYHRPKLSTYTSTAYEKNDLDSFIGGIKTVLILSY